ncbi:MAG: ATP-grasp domain-containing protein [Planctomycetaceae bacterium]|nr:ATP-grasp domain-containing protein [Planctomycetaceae bacterium]
MNRIFVSEAISSGFYSDQPLPASLLREGFAMLTAVCADLQVLPDLEVFTTLDSRIADPLPAGVQVTSIRHPHQEWTSFCQFARESDCTLVIAPELGRELERRVKWLEQNQIRHANSTLTTTALTSDKYAFSQFCNQHAFPTPETTLIENSGVTDEFLKSLDCRKLIIKPRWGAGTVETTVIENRQAFREWFSSKDQLTETEFIVQPFVAGTPASTVCIRQPGGKTIFCPPGRQNFVEGTYQGGRIPDFSGETSQAMQDLAERILELLPGLRGWVGIDYLIPADAPQQPVLLEVNPRLTSSYLGYRKLTSFSLARLLVSDVDHEYTWQEGPIDFSVTE